MTKAEIAAWNIYIARVRIIVEAQNKQFEAGQEPGSITIAPPTRQHVDFVQGAIDAAVKEAKGELIGSLLDPIVEALDAIDNSRSKSDTVKDCRERLGKVYDNLHVLKKRSEEPKADDAVGQR